MTGETRADVRLLVVDDHEMFVESVVRLLDAEPGFRVVATAGTAAEALRHGVTQRPDVVVLDHGLPDAAGAEIAHRLRTESGAQVLLLTGDESDAVLLQAIRAGCEGYVLKTRAYSELVSAVWALRAGSSVMPPDRLLQLYTTRHDADVLTRREMEVLALVADGLPNKEIARRMGLALNTIRNYVQRINDKLGARNKTAAVAAATKQGLLRR